ncbi:hypothetical protein [Psychrobacter sp. I-STPA6b]|uniref:hypothetical protein n=1 Tax=Psychrobacter sp. I-STPA6b TaxID=2585718 RepID=UPI001D0C96C1|nr:hypothetical protein [Psychrobacter sp. I-STPA6b]
MSHLKWLVNVFTLESALLANVLPNNSCIPNEVAVQYEMIVDKELLNIKYSVIPEQFEAFKSLEKLLIVRKCMPEEEFVLVIG